MIWVFHLFGGARATWGQNGEPGPVQVEPHELSGKTLQFPAGSLGEVVRQCNALGLHVFGVASLTHKLEFDGIVPAEWRTIHYQPNSAWLCHEAETCWSQIAHAAARAKSGRLWDCSARIAYQIEACVRRIQQISDAYAIQLSTLLARKAFRDGSRMNDLWTQSVFLAIQSFLTEACVLRDYLAEFAAAFVFRVTGPRRVTTAAGLLKYLRGEKRDDALTRKIQDACGPGGWLAEVGSYRDLVVHSAPLALAQRQLWFWCKAIELPEGKQLPTVRFPLPEDPAGIMAARLRIDFDDFTTLIEEFVSPADISPSMKDALRYAHTVMGEFAVFAAELASHSPIPPQMPVFTDDDLAGAGDLVSNVVTASGARDAQKYGFAALERCRGCRTQSAPTGEASTSGCKAIFRACEPMS